MKAYSSLGMFGGATGLVRAYASARLTTAGGFVLLGYSGYGLYKTLSDDRIPAMEKWVAVAELAGGLSGMARGRTFRDASYASEFWGAHASRFGVRPGLAWRNARWSAGEYLSRVAHNHRPWSVPAWIGANLAGFRTCFAPGTPLRTPDGSRYIEDIRVGDLVLSRDEHNCEGPVEAKVVDEVFGREGLLWYVDANGRRIRTTAEHPFFVAGRGWIPCHDLKVGDRLLTESGAWVTVEAVEDTGVWSTVYNLRVADYHTYFVGCDEWGFAVWAHNADCVVVQGKDGTYRLAQNKPGLPATPEVVTGRSVAEVVQKAQQQGIAGERIASRVVPEPVRQPGQPIPLTVLNEHFVPDMQVIMQRLTDRAVADLTANPSLARGLMSDGSYAHLRNPQSQLHEATFGKAVERLVRDFVQEDPILATQVRHTGQLRGPGGTFISSPDFLANEGGLIRRFDVTTPGKVASHNNRPGYQARPAGYLLYQVPTGLTFR